MVHSDSSGLLSPTRPVLESATDLRPPLRSLRLADKIAAEEVQMQDELIKSQGSREERRAAMVERAIALEKEREEERQQVRWVTVPLRMVREGCSAGGE